MPGRQGNGPLRGGGRGGGGFRGGFRRGPGFGGGWGWGRRPGFWGWGPRFGFGGCGGIGCFLMAALAFLFIIFGAIFGGRSYSANGNGRYNNFGGGSNNSSGGLANQPASVQTQTAVDLAELHNALDSRIPEWQTQIAANEERHASAAEAGMGNDNNIKDIVYGKCGDAFFVFVVDKGVPFNAGSANASGYAYTTSTSPATCHPSQYVVTDSEDDGSGWYFVYLESTSVPPTLAQPGGQQ